MTDQPTINQSINQKTVIPLSVTRLDLHVLSLRQKANKNIYLAVLIKTSLTFCFRRGISSDLDRTATNI